MIVRLAREITRAEIETFERDGVVCLRGIFDDGWLARLEEAIEDVIADPGPFGARYGTDSDSGVFFGDLYVWTFNQVFRDYVYNSPAARVAGELMRSDKTNFFYDHLLVKEPGSSAPTPWHHDLTYWCVEGNQICSVWMPLDRVTRDSGAVEYVRGSHRWPNRFQAQDFMGKDLFRDDALEAIPEIEANRDAYDIVAFDTEPGDCIVHHALTMHGAPGNTSSRRRRALSTRWTGDDARYVVRKGMSRPIREPGLRPGDPMDCELFPVIWRRAA